MSRNPGLPRLPRLFLCFACCMAWLLPLHAFASIVLIAASVTTTEGSQFSGQVATFTTNDPNSVASNFSATVDWGDGTVNNGSVGSSAGAFTVYGSHTYVSKGSSPLKIYVQGVDSTGTYHAQASATGLATILEAPLTAVGAIFMSEPNVTFSAIVATFRDGNPFAFPEDFTAVIHWGDGMSTAGTIAKNASAPGFAVYGSHTYFDKDPKQVTVEIGEPGSTGVVATSLTVPGESIHVSSFD